MAVDDVQLKFRDVIHWNVDVISQDFAQWLAADNANPPATSRVAILSSMDCQRMLQPHLSSDLYINLRLLIKTSSLLVGTTKTPHPIYSRELLNTLRCSVGAKLLRNLEEALKVSALARASKAKLMGLFLALLGSVISVAYTRTQDCPMVQTDLEDARRSLLCILSHHMIFLGERIGLLEHDFTNRRLTETCYTLWNKTGGFRWEHSTMPSLNVSGMCSVQQDMSDCVLPGSPSAVANKYRASLNASQTPCTQDLRNAVSPGNTSGLGFGRNGIVESSLGPGLSGAIQEDSRSMFTTIPLMPNTISCFLCGNVLPSDDLCKNCFGPRSSIADDNFKLFPEVISSTPVIPSHQPFPPSDPVHCPSRTQEYRTFEFGLYCDTLPKIHSSYSSNFNYTSQWRCCKCNDGPQASRTSTGT